MNYRKTYIDAGVLIAAVRGDIDTGTKAMKILDESNRRFVASDYLKLELIPKATYYKNDYELRFYQEFFKNVFQWAGEMDAIIKEAQCQASSFGLAAMDALHVAAAMSVDADEFITTEKLSKPIHRVVGINVVSIV